MKRLITLLTVLMLGLTTFTQATASTFQQSKPITKSGNPDKRYNANKHLTKSGKMDMRYKSSKKVAAKTKS
jgi:hypothetical protein